MEEIRKEELQRDSLQNEDLNDLEVLSMPELYDTAYMPRLPVIEGLLNCGLCIFSGAPKTGKSFLVKSNRLGLRMEGGSDPIRQADCPQCSLATKDGEARVKDLGCLLFFSLFISLIHSLIRSFTCDL